MFKIRHKSTLKIYTVYFVRHEKVGYGCEATFFLIYRNNGWVWVGSMDYEPLEDIPYYDTETIIINKA